MQKVDLFLFFFLSVREGGAGASSPDLFLTLVLLRPYAPYIHFQENFKITLKCVANLVVDAQLIK